MLGLGVVVGATGLSPNSLTLIGLVLNGVAAGLVVAGAVTAEWLAVGGIAFLLASSFDMLDGAVARATGTASRFGAFLDSVIDRYDEALMFIALVVVFSVRQDHGLVTASTAALIGSLLVSYARARAEGLGLDCEIGLLQRPERVLLLTAGLLAAPILLAPVIWVLAVVTNITVVQRILHVRRLTLNAEGEEQSGAAEPSNRPAAEQHRV
jgi:CDP-diacylglycerol--glycerol-3-phosphate 3-phosphatidyltransferase